MGQQAGSSPRRRKASPAPPSHTQHTPPCTNKYLANEAPVAPGVGNRLHSLHSPHPAPPGLGAARRGMRKLLGAGSGSRAAAEDRCTDPGSVLDPPPKEVLDSTDLLKDTPRDRSCF